MSSTSARTAADKEAVGGTGQSRLWRRMPWTVVLLPLTMLAATYALMLSEQTVIVTTLAFYAAIWHRGRQSLGVACYYQRQKFDFPMLRVGLGEAAWRHPMGRQLAA